jgi:hypothetical protein
MKYLVAFPFAMIEVAIHYAQLHGETCHGTFWRAGIRPLAAIRPRAAFRTIETSKTGVCEVRNTSIRDVRLLATNVRAGSKPIKLIKS